MSNSAAYSRAADLTHKQPKPGPGMNVDLMFVQCGHKGGRTGAKFINGVPMKCASCMKRKQ